jgi:hypothetical protein
MSEEEMEEQALEFIKNCGSKGVLQSQLWKHLNATSRDGSRIAVSLEEAGSIERQKELHKGRWTYRIYYIKNEPEKVEWDTLDNCPCFLCESLDICARERAIKCKDLLKWMVESTS